MKGFFLLIILSLFLSQVLLAQVLEPNLPNSGVISPYKGHQMDVNHDYTVFVGRLSDRSDNEEIFKVKFENDNVRFLQAGDEISFKVQNNEDRQDCIGRVLSTEKNYLTFRIRRRYCWPKNKYIPRGLVLKFESMVMAKRVLQGSEFRKVLIKQKDDFLDQLERVNKFLWTYDTQKTRLAAKYEKEILRLEKEKKRRLDAMIKLKEEKIQLQSSLQTKLNELDDALEFYKIDRREYITDRWNQDEDSHAPVARRPSPLKQR